jgi:hypothetical protein
MMKAMHPWDAIWIFLILSSLQPVGAKDASRAMVITPIHRQESLSLLGIPLMRRIEIDDAEAC